MMLKRLGIFALLAVCFFAIVIVIGGCEEGGGGVEVEVEVPPVTVPEGMVLIPAGTFEMGSNDAAAADDEQPVHTVHLTAFYMDKHEVTNAQFKTFIDENPEWGKDRIADWRHKGHYLDSWDGTDYPFGTADHPVVEVSWFAAVEYARWAEKQLPTEAQWEYAARGGLAGKKYPWGDAEPTSADANYGANVGHRTPVGEYPANGYGLYDMAGNVSEWCFDAYDAETYAESDDSLNPIATGIDTGRVLRGGSWASSAWSVRVARRSRASSVFTLGSLGFRCSRPVTP